MRNLMPPQPLNALFRLQVFYRLKRKRVKVELFIMVADELYGPYQTTVQTSETVWNDRRTAMPGPAALLLNKQLWDIRVQLSKAWSDLLPTDNHKAGVILTGDRILQKAGLSNLLGKEGQPHG